MTTEQKHSITRDMTIEKIFSQFPQYSAALAHAMASKGLHCVGCGAATWETLEAGMLGHGMSEEDIEDLLKQLNAIIAETFDFTTISLTKAAAEKFQEFAKEEGKEGYTLRFGEVAEGCGGQQYALDFSQSPSSEEVVFESHGVKIFVHKNHLPRLKGSIIDYVNSMKGGGFKVNNPNVKSSCGCGNSHGY